MPSFERTQWKKVKEQHAKALSAKKVVFNKDLGPTLDKIAALDQKIREHGPDDETKKALKKLCDEADSTADFYSRSIKGKVGDPAETDLRVQLTLMREWIRNKRPG
jgi:hypothetical protein